MKQFILLVEDNEQVMNQNADFLSAKGYQIMKAFNLKEAEKILVEWTPDLLVMDVMLPDGDGVAFCEKLRQSSNVPVLFLTAKDSADDMIEGLSRGGDDYLTKPCDLAVLLARVQSLLRRSSIIPEHLRLGEMVFDLPMGILYVRGEALKLSQKEYGMLLYLARQRGRMVPKEELYKAVWGQEMYEDGSALWSSFSRLKTKVKSYERYFELSSTHSGYELIINEV